jgi:hypothetical protein
MFASAGDLLSVPEDERDRTHDRRQRSERRRDAPFGVLDAARVDYYRNESQEIRP